MHRITASIVAILIFTASAGAVTGLHPPDGKLLYSSHVLFLWDADPQAAYYQLQVDLEGLDEPFVNPVIDRQTSARGVIQKGGIRFGERYVWRQRGMRANGNGLGWSDTLHFELISIPDSVLNGHEIVTSEPERMQPGVSLICTFGEAFAMEPGGRIVWFMPRDDPDFGALFDVRQYPDGSISGIGNGAVWLIDIYREIVWGSHLYQVPPGLAHHEAYLTPNGNCMYLVVEHRWFPRGDNDSVYWRGDVIQEINRQGDLIWSWHCFDHLSHEDYDTVSYNNTAPGGVFDWTHSNACTFDRAGGAIYLSIRNLSRIVKIAYPEGNIIWSMGREYPSGDVDFGGNLEFYLQHAPEEQPNGNLLFFDNHWFGVHEFSRAVEIELDFQDEDPARVAWEYRTDFGTNKGDADRMPNGNTLISGGGGQFLLEVTRGGEVVWEVRRQVRPTFYRCKRVPSLYPLALITTGPADSSLIPSESSFVRYRVNNLGGDDQVFQYEFRDSRGWLAAESGIVEVEAGRWVNLTMLGWVPQVEEWNQLTFILTPVVAPHKADTLIVHVYPGEPNYVADGGTLPAEFSVTPAYPNPFNSQVSVDLRLPNHLAARVNIYDIAGRMLETYPVHAGRFVWGGTDLRGQRVAAGNYILEISTPEAKRMQTISFVP